MKLRKGKLNEWDLKMKEWNQIIREWSQTMKKWKTKSYLLRERGIA